MTTLRQQWLSTVTETASAGARTQEGGCYLPDLCVMTFTGPESADFLQGYLTCDISSLRDNALQPWALCNLKGRVVANGWCTPERNGAVTLVTHRSLAEVLTDFFRPYLMFAKTELSLRSDDVLVFGFQRSPGPDALAVGAAGLDVGHYMRLVTDLPAATRTYDSYTHADAWHAMLIRGATCLVTQQTSATFLPQMLGLDTTGAVSFDKGCYLGQEVVARAQHRGTVKRRMHQLHWSGHKPQPGETLVTTDGKKSGAIVNAAATGEAEGLALAVVTNETEYPLRTRREREHDTVLIQSH